MNFIQPDEFPYDQGLIFQDGRELEYDSGDYPASLEKLKALVGWDEFPAFRAEMARRGPPGRHRPGLLRRGHRRRALRGRARAHRDLRQGQGRHRPDHPGPGARDGLRPDRRRRARRAVRGRRGGHRRHPPDAVRRRHVRLARRRDERRRPIHLRREAGQGEGAADRGRRARGRPDDLEIVDGVVSVQGRAGVGSIDLGTVAVLSNPLRYAFDEASKAGHPVLASATPASRRCAEDDEPGLEGKDFYSPERSTFASGMHAVIVETDPRHRRDHDPASTPWSTTAAT